MQQKKRKHEVRLKHAQEVMKLLQFEESPHYHAWVNNAKKKMKQILEKD